MNTITMNQATMTQAAFNQTQTRERKQKRAGKRLVDKPTLFTLLIVIANIFLAILVHPFTGGNELISDLACSIVPAALLALLTKLLLKDEFTFGLHKEGIGKTFKLSSVIIFGSFVTFAINMITEREALMTTPKGILAAICFGLAAGISEEFINRGIICNNAMRIWRDHKHGVYMSAIFSALVFGLGHIINVYATGLTLGLMTQIAFATAMGMIFGAIYLRTRNLLGVIIAHTLWDISALLFASGTATGDVSEAIKTNVNSVSIAGVIFNAVVITIAVSTSLYLLRPSKHEEIKAHWNA